MGEAIIQISTGSISASGPVLCVLYPVYGTKLVFLIAGLMEYLLSNRYYLLLHFPSFNSRVRLPSSVKMHIIILRIFCIAKNIYIWNHVCNTDFQLHNWEKEWEKTIPSTWRVLTLYSLLPCSQFTATLPLIQLNLAAAQTSTQIIDTVLSSHLMTPFLPSIKSHLHLCHFLNKHNWPKEEETSHGYKWKLYYRQSARKQLKWWYDILMNQN